MRKYRSGFSAVVMILGVVLTVGLAGAFYLYLNRTKITLINTTQETKQPTNEAVVTTKIETGTEESPFGKFVVSSDVTTTENCGEESCFNKKFKECLPATLLAESSLGSIRYTILKKDATGCTVSMMYTANPNSEWINKEMVCTLDNTKNISDAVAEAFNKIFSKELVCSGPLYQVLIDLNKPQ